MSPLTEPLRPGDAKKLLRAILAGGEVGFTSHAIDEMEQDGISPFRSEVAAIIVTAWRMVR